MTSSNKFPWEIRNVKPVVACELAKYFKNGHTSYIRVGSKGYFFPKTFQDEAANIYNMQLRSSDVFVASYPRSGSTWTRELVWIVANDWNFAKSETVPLVRRFMFLEFPTFVNPTLKEKIMKETEEAEKINLLDMITQPGTARLARTESPRFIYTHLPLSLLPPSLLDTVYWTPYFENVKEAWAKRLHPNMLFIFYEDMSKDLPSVIRRVASFLGKPCNEEHVLRLNQHLSIDSFKSNKSVNYEVMDELGLLNHGEQPYIRKGKTGGWCDYFDEEMTQQAELWISDNLRDTDLRFPHMEL